MKIIREDRLIPVQVVQVCKVPYLAYLYEDTLHLLATYTAGTIRCSPQVFAVAVERLRPLLEGANGL